MKRDWEPEELIDCWTLGENDRRLLRNKTGPTRLGLLSIEVFRSWMGFRGRE
jgi:hypothetical protein